MTHSLALTRASALALIALMALTAAACKDDAPKTDAPKAGATKDGDAAKNDGAAKDGAKDSAKADAAAKTLTIYSGRNEKLVGPVIAQFEKEKGYKVRVKYGESQPLAAALIKEGARTEADVFLAQDVSTLGFLADKDALAPLPDAITGKVEGHFRDPKGRWVGVSGRARTLVYNTTKLKPEDLPADAAGLTDPKWKGRVGWAPENASFKSAVSAMIQQDGAEKATAWLKGMKANAPKAYPKNTPAVRATAKGEVDVALVNHYYLFRIKKELGDDAPIANHYFKNGKSESLVNVSGIGMVKASKNTKGAEEFAAYLLSNTGQTFFTETNSEFPLVKGIKTKAGLPDITTLNPPKINFTDLSDLEATEKALRDAEVLP